jgi:hypothetical protein
MWEKGTVFTLGTGEVVLLGAMKAYKGSRLWLHSYLTSALNGCEWSTSRLGHFTPGKTVLLPMELKACSSQELFWTFRR